MIEDGHNFDHMFLDFSKAFDKMDYLILSKKLSDKKIMGKMAT